MTPVQTTADKFLGGRLTLLQPRDGYRAGVDPVLLAAACPAQSGERVLELGCGAGAAILCLAARVGGLHLTGVEIQPDYADLARRNAEANAVTLRVVTADLAQLPAEIRQEQFDQIIANPPYFERSSSTPARDPGRETAQAGALALHQWITVAASRLAPGGQLTLIQRSERLPEALAAAESVLGSTLILPISARPGRASDRFILRARKGGRAAFRLLAPLVMHEGDRHIRDGDSYSAEVTEILRGGAGLTRFG